MPDTSNKFLCKLMLDYFFNHSDWLIKVCLTLAELKIYAKKIFIGTWPGLEVTVGDS